MYITEYMLKTSDGLEALQIKLVPKGTENPELPTPASAKKEAFIKK